jgi:hypothetical protein
MPWTVQWGSTNWQKHFQVLESMYFSVWLEIEFYLFLAKIDKQKLYLFSNWNDKKPKHIKVKFVGFNSLGITKDSDFQQTRYYVGELYDCPSFLSWESF